MRKSMCVWLSAVAAVHARRSLSRARIGVVPAELHGVDDPNGITTISYQQGVDRRTRRHALALGPGGRVRERFQPASSRSAQAPRRSAAPKLTGTIAASLGHGHRARRNGDVRRVRGRMQPRQPRAAGRLLARERSPAAARPSGCPCSSVNVLETDPTAASSSRTSRLPAGSSVKLTRTDPEGGRGVQRHADAGTSGISVRLPTPAGRP